MPSVFFMLNISQVILVRTDSNLCRKEFTVHWSVHNSLIRSYLQPCTNSMSRDESDAVAPIIWLYQTMDARKEEVFFPDLLITLRRHVSVCLSVRLSVTPFWLCSHHRIIMKFSGVITNDKSDVHAKGQGQRSKVKVTEVNTQLNRFRTVTPVWIYIWWWNDAYSLMLLRRGTLLFLKVIHQISRSHGSKKRRIWPRMGVSGL